MTSRVFAAFVAVMALLAASGCPREVTGGLALGGAKKYKADMLACISNITAEIDAGEVNYATIKKFDGILKKYEAEFSSAGTYMTAVKVQEHLHKGQADPGSAFRENQMAKQEIMQLIDYFKTEVPD